MSLTAPPAAGTRELILMRTLDATPATVFAAWTDPATLARWWGPKHFTNPVCEADARPGGELRIDMRGPDGTVYPCTGTFREVSPPTRLVFTTRAFETPDAKAQLEVLNTLTLAELPHGTSLTLQAVVLHATEAVAEALAGMPEGWNQSLDRLSELLREPLSSAQSGPGSQAAPRPFVISRTFSAPPEAVFAAWTETQRMARWFGPRGFVTRVASNDLRPGGTYHYCLQSPDGKTMWGKWIYRQVLPPRRLVFINCFSDEGGGVTRHPLNADWPLEMLTTVDFTAQGGNTTVTIRWEPIDPSEAELQAFEAGRESMHGGWTGTLDQLGQYLSAP